MVLARYKKLENYSITFNTDKGAEVEVPANKFIQVVETYEDSYEFGKEVVDNIFFLNLQDALGFVKWFNERNLFTRAKLTTPILAERLDPEVVEICVKEV